MNCVREEGSTERAAGYSRTFGMGVFSRRKPYVAGANGVEEP